MNLFDGALGLALAGIELHIVEPGLLPSVQDGIETWRIPAHRDIRWLARFLPITPYVEIEAPRFVPQMIRTGHKVFCTAAQARALADAIPARRA